MLPVPKSLTIPAHLTVYWVCAVLSANMNSTGLLSAPVRCAIWNVHLMILPIKSALTGTPLLSPICASSVSSHIWATRKLLTLKPKPCSVRAMSRFLIIFRHRLCQCRWVTGLWLSAAVLPASMPRFHWLPVAIR